jgi:hypothetical protein
VRNLVPVRRASASVSLVHCNTSYCALSLISLELFFRVALPRLSPPYVFRGSYHTISTRTYLRYTSDTIPTAPPYIPDLSCDRSYTLGIHFFTRVHWSFIRFGKHRYSPWNGKIHLFLSVLSE